MVLIRSRTRSSPSAAILAGVSASTNRAGVALLTPASVACAESTTATSNVNGLTYCSSVFGAGLASAKRRNTSSMSAMGIGWTSPCAAVRSAFARFGAGLTLAFVLALGFAFAAILALRRLADGLGADFLAIFLVY